MKAANQTHQVDNNLNVSMSYEEIAQRLNITVKEAKDAETSAIKKLKHPRIGKKIKDYLGI